MFALPSAGGGMISHVYRGAEMLPPRYDFDDILKGNDWSREIEFEADSGPLDLTGSEVVFFAGVFGNIFRKSSATPGSGFEVTDAANGKVKLTLTHDETRNLTVGRTRYEIERRAGGIETTLLMGELVVTEWVNDDE